MAWRAGAPGWAAAGALLIIFGYALVLGVEFMLLARLNRSDPAPPASARLLLSAWWGEVCSAPTVFCWRQPFRSRHWPDHLPAQAQGRRGLLLIHGFVCNRGIWNRWYARLQALGIAHVAVNLEPVFGPIDASAAIVEAAVRQLEDTTGLAPVVVAHSMGGLALRHWWALPGNAARVHHAITLGTPHHGTWLARFAFSANGRQMRRGGAWLQALAQRETPGLAAQFTCFYSHCDNIVFPASTATLAGADNRHLPGQAHVHMVDRPEPFEAVLSRLRG
ncbi:MAG: permease [Rubrivivax sp.]|nr:permease [Rubrivivax sp.]